MAVTGERPEFARIRHLLEDPHETALVVVGAAGSGKTHLLTEVHEGFAWESVIVRANPAEATWPLSGFSTIFSSIGDRRAIEFGGRFAIRAADEGNMFAAANDLLSILRSLQLPPLLVLVDDVDRMDEQSRVLLGAMSGRLAGTHLRIVATASRVPSDGSLDGMLSIDLAPGDERSLLEIAEALYPRASEGTVRILLEHSAGNPRALLTALGALTPGQLAGEVLLRLPPQPDAGGADRIAECADLGERAGELLLRLSAGPVAVAEAIAGDDAEAMDALSDLQDAGLVDEVRGLVRLRDPLLRSALYWSLDSRGRRGLHEDLAARSAAIDPRVAVWHRAAVSAASADSAELLEIAAGLARDDLVPAAIEFAELARVGLAVRGAGEREVQGLLLLGSALLLRGELALAARCTELARHASPDSALRFHAMRLRAAVSFLDLKHVQPPELSGDPTDPASSAAAGDLAVLTAALFAMRGETAQARRMLEAAQVRGAGGDDGRRRPPVPMVADLIDAVENAPMDPAARQSAQGPIVEGDRSFGEVLLESETACLRERYDDAHRLTGYVLDRAAEPMWRELAAYQRARHTIRSGMFHEARIAVAEWAAMPPAQGSWVSRWVLRAWGEFADERYVEATELLAEAATLNHRYRAVDAAAALHALRGQLALTTGDLSRAVHELTAADLVSAPVGNPALVRHLPDLVEALVRLGRDAEAAETTARLAAAAAEHPSRWAQLALERSRALVAPPEEAIAAFDAAIAGFEPGDSEFELALTLAARAGRLASLGLRSSAEAAASEASAQFSAAGAQAWAGRLAATGPARLDTVPDARLSLLTPSEREIALLVAEGLRNKEIAARLYVSVRTVELRLTTIYRKLGARSRSHLAAMLA